MRKTIYKAEQNKQLYIKLFYKKKTTIYNSLKTKTRL